MLRPRPCRWFELIASRDDVAGVMEALARAGAVELQTHAPRAAPLVIPAAERALEHFHELARTHRAHWPAAGSAGTAHITDPAATLAAQVGRLDAWRVQADPLIAELERLDAQARQIADLARLLAAAGGRLPEPGLLAGAGRFAVDARIYALAAHGPASSLPPGVLQLTVPGGDQAADEDFVVLVGRIDDLGQVDDQFAARKARRIDWPADLRGGAPQAAQEVAARRRTLEQRRAAVEGELRALAQQHELARVLADIEVVEWLIRHGSEVSASERLVWVTGWTTAPDLGHLCAPVEGQGLRCVAQFPAPPDGSEPPSLLANPPWVRAFEGFARMLGQPGRNEGDPSPLVALIAPLLFGFMFGDVGQGAVLCLAGWWLHKRWPMLVLLVPGGLMAMVFGLLFGTVFAREDLIPALWLHPLHEPVKLLIAAVGLGALVLVGGLALSALQAFWRRAVRAWWAHEAALVLAYAGALAGFAVPEAFWLIPAGALWAALGSAWATEGSRPGAFAGGLAQFLEHALQLAVNTVSFARVGAFALAHAGLSVAVTGVAEASGALGYWIVLLLGNLLILVLEGLVVSIQTTRLLLFEFFVRFLEGTGRAFRPLPPPLVHPNP